MIDEELVRCVVQDLSKPFTDSQSRPNSAAMERQIDILICELITFQFFLFCFGKFNDLPSSSSFGSMNKDDSRFADILTRIEAILESGEFEDWYTLSPELLKNIHIFNLAIKEDCSRFLDCLSRCKFSSLDLEKLMTYTRFCLHNFPILKDDFSSEEVVKIKSLEDQLLFFIEAANAATIWGESHVKMEHLKIQIQAWASDAACFSLLNWILYVKDENGCSPTTTDDANILSDLQKKLKFTLPELVRMCLAFLIMVLEPSVDKSKLVAVFVDCILRKLQVDDVGNLRNGMEFLIKFLTNHSDIKYANDGKLILTATAANNFYFIPSIELLSLMDHVSVLLSNFLVSEGALIPENKVKIKSLVGNMSFFKAIFQRCRNRPEKKDLKIQIQAWTFDAAVLCLQICIQDEKDDENMEPATNLILSDLLQKLYTTLLEVTRMSLPVLIAPEPSQHDENPQVIGTLATGFAEFLLGNMQADISRHDVGKLQNEMEFLITFLMNHHDLMKYANDVNFIPNIELVSLMDHTQVLLHNFLPLKGSLIPELKVKIKPLVGDMVLLKRIFHFTCERCKSYKEMKSFKFQIQAWAFNAAALCLQISIQDEMDENMEPTQNIILSDFLQKLDIALPEITRKCLAALIASKQSEHDESLAIGTLVTSFVDFLLRTLQVDLPMDDIQMLQNGITFLIAFLIGEPDQKYANDGKLVSTAIATTAKDVVASLITSLNAGKRNTLLLDFLGKVKALEAVVRKLYASLFVDLSSFHFPRFNILGLFDSLIENLKRISINYPMPLITKIQEELVFLRSFLKPSNSEERSISKLQNEHNELNLWRKIVKMAYQIERTISSFMYMKSSVCVHMLCLFDVAAEIKHIVAEVKRTKEHHLHGIDSLSTESNLSPGALLQTDVQSMDDLVVGFEDEVKEITDWLRSGSRELDILSIIGMAGMGKTTLAKKVYDDPSIKHYFTKYAWCTVSQSYNCKKLLLDILKDVTLVDDSFFKMEEEDLAHKLRKCLNGQKYLIVMDDMWDIGAWKELKLSFPNDKKGSRIVFTSRIHNVASEAKSDSHLYPLSSLTEEKSWNLLEKRLFHKRSCPRNFVQVGKKIARDCKGLPLAIVLVAGLLKDQLQNLDWWKQIGENLGSRISQGGCAIIIEQSYKHLSEALKPCFLYFGSFREDKVIRVQKLIQLWVSEGFIGKHKLENLETVAAEYLMDLIARSLVVVTERSSSGGIKACQIHDLLWEFCLAKAEEENFSHVLRGNDNSRVSRTTLDEHYRVCIQSKDWTSFMSWNSSALQSLLFSPTATYNLSDVQYLSVENSKFLQVLDLEDVKLFGEFPKSITKLVLLRYMAIQCTARSIPPEISKLLNLETFCVRRSQYGLRLPDTMLEMKKLRHVDVGHCLLPYLWAYLWDSSAILENIQSFSSPCLACEEETKILLRKIAKVRKLKCEFNPKRQDNQILELDFLEKLESLNTTCMPKNLGRCPFSFPSNLKKLTLKDFGIPWIEISTMATMLPNLEVLKLLKNAFTGKAWTVGNDEFPKLKFLKLQALDIEQWDASEESFPFLEELVVDKCHKFERFPSEFGNNVYLRKIQVEWCRSTVAESAMQIQEDLVDLGNADLKVIIGRFSDAQ